MDKFINDWELWEQEVLEENQRLKEENFELKYKLEQAEKKYSDFLYKMSGESTSLSWVKAILSGDLKLEIKK